MKTLLIASLLLIGTLIWAAEKTVAPKTYPLKTCIVTDNDLDSMGEQASFVYQGQTIKVCCKPCIAKFEKNPAKYLKKLEGK
jgi:YHS domain-containing protein